DRLAVCAISPPNGSHASKPIARRALVVPEVALLERIALSVVAPPNDGNAAPTVGLQPLVRVEVTLLRDPPLEVVPPADDGQTGTLVFDQFPAGAQISPLDRVPGPVVLELDRVDAAGVGRGPPVGPDKVAPFGVARVVHANGCHAEGRIGSGRTAT